MKGFLFNAEGNIMFRYPSHPSEFFQNVCWHIVYPQLLGYEATMFFCKTATFVYVFISYTERFCTYKGKKKG